MQDCFSTACCCESGTSAGGQLGNKRKSQLNCTGREAYPSSQMPWAEFMPIPGSESAEDLHTMGKAPEFVLMRKETSSSPPEPQNRAVCPVLHMSRLWFNPRRGRDPEEETDPTSHMHRGGRVRAGPADCCPSLGPSLYISHAADFPSQPRGQLT